MVNGLLVKPNDPVNVADAVEKIYYDSKLKNFSEKWKDDCRAKI